MSAYGHREFLVTLALQHAWKRGALLGLGSGTLFNMLLCTVPGLFVVGVDHFVRMVGMHRVMSVASYFSRRCVVHCCTTGQAAALVDDDSLDFVFIDAGHKYGCTRSDIRLWWPKVRVGGWFGGHAYSAEHPGVVQAVNERFDDAVYAHDYSVWAVEKRNA